VAKVITKIKRVNFLLRHSVVLHKQVNCKVAATVSYEVCA